MASFVGRLMTGIQAGIQAFRYNPQDMVPDPVTRNWDLFNARLSRYYILDDYYNNTIYTSVATYAAMHRHLAGLYRHIRGVYNPVMRGCDLFAANVYPGPLDMENFAKGAIPLAGTNDTFKNGFRQLAIWSNWQAQKARYVRDAAKYGDVFIKVCDDPVKQKVYLELLDPRLIKDMQVDSQGNIQQIVIEYTKTEDTLLQPTSAAREQQTYTYTEIINKDRFQTFRDGQPYAYYANAAGELVSEWPNDYGFVPVVQAKFKDVGMTFGAAAFQATLRKIDELNDAASNLLDQVRKVVTPLWYFAGVARSEELDTSPDEVDSRSGVLKGKDKLRAIFGPLGSQPYPMIAPIDITAASAQYMNVFAEIQRDMPILSLPDIRQQIQATAPGVAAAFQDGIAHIVEAQGALDDPFRRAVQMAFSMAALRRYKNFTAFSPYSYERGDLDFYIPTRTVIKDELTKSERVTFLVQTNAPQSAVWKELDVTDDTIQEWKTELAQDQQTQELQVQQQIDSIARQGALAAPSAQRQLPERVA